MNKCYVIKPCTVCLHISSYFNQAVKVSVQKSGSFLKQKVFLSQLKYYINPDIKDGIDLVHLQNCLQVYQLSYSVPCFDDAGK